MDQSIYTSLSHTHYWYEVGMLKLYILECPPFDSTIKVRNVRVLEKRGSFKASNVSRT